MDDHLSDHLNGNRRLRIAMLVPPWYELPPPGYGGLEQMCAALVDALVARGHEVTVFGAGTRSGTRARFVPTVARPQYLRLGEGLPEMLHVSRANLLIEDSDVDVVHDHTSAGLLTAGSRTAPTVTTVHSCPTGEVGDYLSCLDRSVALVAISSAQRRSRPDLAWAATVHNGLAISERPARFTPDGGGPGGGRLVDGAPGGGRLVDGAPGGGRLVDRPPDRRPVLWLARFSPDKGPDLAIRACRAARLPLVLAGKCTQPDERRYLSEVIAPMLGPDVELVLNADRRRCQALLRGARCLIMPIRWEEPFGMVMVEAMAEGTPVVALDRGAVPEIVRPGVSGLICTEPPELPEALRQVTAIDPDACAAQARRSFAADLMARRYEQVYRSAIRDFTTASPPVLAATRRP